MKHLPTTTPAPFPIEPFAPLRPALTPRAEVAVIASATLVALAAVVCAGVAALFALGALDPVEAPPASAATPQAARQAPQAPPAAVSERDDEREARRQAARQQQLERQREQEARLVRDDARRQEALEAQRKLRAAREAEMEAARQAKRQQQLQRQAEQEARRKLAGQLRLLDMTLRRAEAAMGPDPERAAVTLDQLRVELGKLDQRFPDLLQPYRWRVDQLVGELPAARARLAEGLKALARYQRELEQAIQAGEIRGIERAQEAARRALDGCPIPPKDPRRAGTEALIASAQRMRDQYKLAKRQLLAVSRAVSQRSRPLAQIEQELRKILADAAAAGLQLPAAMVNRAWRSLDRLR